MGTVKVTHPETVLTQKYSKRYKRLVQSFDSRYGKGAYMETAGIILGKLNEEIEFRILYGFDLASGSDTTSIHRIPLCVYQEGNP